LFLLLLLRGRGRFGVANGLSGGSLQAWHATLCIRPVADWGATGYGFFEPITVRRSGTAGMKAYPTDTAVL